MVIQEDTVVRSLDRQEGTAVQSLDREVNVVVVNENVRQWSKKMEAVVGEVEIWKA